MNKYLEKIAVVRSAVKNMRRAAQMAQTGSHDFHTTLSQNLPKILNSGKLRVGTGGHDVHGAGVYFGHKKPAYGAEPGWRNSGVAVPTSTSRTTVDVPSMGDTYSISKKDVPLSSPNGKSYMFMPDDEKFTRVGKEALSLARKNKLRVLKNSDVNSAFSKQIPDYDILSSTRLKRPPRQKIINMMKNEDKAVASLRSSGINAKNPWRSS